MAARDYAPQLGTFTQQDSYQGAAANPASMNRFLYAHANPATLIDPDGHMAMETGGYVAPVVAEQGESVLDQIRDASSSTRSSRTSSGSGGGGAHNPLANRSNTKDQFSLAILGFQTNLGPIWSGEMPFCGLRSESDGCISAADAGFGSGSKTIIRTITKSADDVALAATKAIATGALDDFARTGASALARKTLLDVWRSGPVRAGIYEFVTKSGLKYVGQSWCIPCRLVQHVIRGKVEIDEAINATRWEVRGGTSAREVAEQLRINELGGIRKWVDGGWVQNLANKVNPIGEARSSLMQTFRNLGEYLSWLEYHL